MKQIFEAGDRGAHRGADRVWDDAVAIATEAGLGRPTRAWIVRAAVAVVGIASLGWVGHELSGGGADGTIAAVGVGSTSPVPTAEMLVVAVPNLDGVQIIGVRAASADLLIYELSPAVSTAVVVEAQPRTVEAFTISVDQALAWAELNGADSYLHDEGAPSLVTLSSEGTTALWWNDGVEYAMTGAFDSVADAQAWVDAMRYEPLAPQWLSEPEVRDLAAATAEAERLARSVPLPPGSARESPVDLARFEASPTSENLAAAIGSNASCEWLSYYLADEATRREQSAQGLRELSGWPPLGDSPVADLAREFADALDQPHPTVVAGRTLSIAEAHRDACTSS